MKYQMQVIRIYGSLDTDFIVPFGLFPKFEFLTLFNEVLVEDGVLFAEHGHILTDTYQQYIKVLL